MKKLILSFFLFQLYGCSFFEEDHEVKEMVRDYLIETMHNPNSFEEVNWVIMDQYIYGIKDTAYLVKDKIDIGNSTRAIDFKRTIEYRAENGITKLLRLDFRAENGFGVLRKSSKYFMYFVKDQLLEVDNKLFSKSDGYLGELRLKSSSSPKLFFLYEMYYSSQREKGTPNGFVEKYPEFK